MSRQSQRGRSNRRKGLGGDSRLQRSWNILCLRAADIDDAKQRSDRRRRHAADFDRTHRCRRDSSNGRGQRRNLHGRRGLDEGLWVRGFLGSDLDIIGRAEFEESEVGQEARTHGAMIGSRAGRFWSGRGLNFRDRFGNDDRRRENRRKRDAVIGRSLGALEHRRLDRVLCRGPGRELVGQHAQQFGWAIGRQCDLGPRPGANSRSGCFRLHRFGRYRHGELDYFGRSWHRLHHHLDGCRVDFGRRRFAGGGFAFPDLRRAPLHEFALRRTGEADVRRQEEMALPGRIAIVAGNLRQRRQRLAGRRGHLCRRIGRALTIKARRAAKRFGLLVGRTAGRRRRLVQLIGVGGFRLMGGHTAQRIVMRTIEIIRLVCIMQSSL